MLTHQGRKKIPSWRWLAAIGVALLAVGIAVGQLVARDDASSAHVDRDRQAAVAKRGAGVMPFDLDRTTHVFTPSASGGVQEVIAEDPDDLDQIRLIRQHLVDEADRFARGDFADPVSIHGDDMPGLRTLRAKYGSMEARYIELADGAKITYASSDPAVVEALHDWFEAQLGDHAEHAKKGE